MKTLILYTTKYGFTEDCIQNLAGQLEGEVQSVNLMESKAPDLADADQVILGGAVYIGHVDKKLRTFCEQNLEALLGKRTGLFLSCGLPENFQQSLEASFPAPLIENAAGIECFGGELRVERMKALDKIMTNAMKKSAAGTGAGDPCMNPEGISKLATAMNERI